ncbi:MULTISPECIES: hypothetical protein [unclassified Microcoleus]
MLSGLTPAAWRYWELKALRSGLFEVLSNLEVTTPIIAYAIEVFGFL